MQNWFDRQLQRDILLYLKHFYPDSLQDRTIAKAIFPTYTFTFKSRVFENIGYNIPCNLTSEDSKFLQIQSNIYYLYESGLINLKNHGDNHSKYFSCQINSVGIDFLEDDGGLSAILNVITVKLHADTIKALVIAKIEADNNLSNEEKSKFKEALNTISETALTTMTEKAIEAIPVAALLAVLQTFIS